MWKGISQSLRPDTKTNSFVDTIPPDILNQYFSSNSYDATRPTTFTNDFTPTNPDFAPISTDSDSIFIDEMVIERQLHALKNSSPGAYSTRC